MNGSGILREILWSDPREQHLSNTEGFEMAIEPCGNSLSHMIKKSKKFFETDRNFEIHANLYMAGATGCYFSKLSQALQEVAKSES